MLLGEFHLSTFMNIDTGLPRYKDFNGSWEWTQDFQTLSFINMNSIFFSKLYIIGAACMIGCVVLPIYTWQGWWR